MHKACPCEELIAEHYLLLTRIEEAKAECDALYDSICEFEVDEAPQDGKFGVFFRAVEFLTNRVVAGETSVNWAEVQAREPLPKKSELQSLVEGLPRAVGCGQARDGNPVNVEFS